MEFNSSVTIEGDFHTAEWLNRKSTNAYKYGWAEHPFHAYIDAEDIVSVIKLLESSLNAVNITFHNVTGNSGYVIFDVIEGVEVVSAMLHLRNFYHGKEREEAEMPAGIYCIAHLHTGSHKLETAIALADRVREVVANAKVPKPEPLPEYPTIWVNFWYVTPQGPRSIGKLLSVPTWDDIAANYTPDTREHITSLVDSDPRKLNGNIILWLGEPGTGKTFAIRSLGYAWEDDAVIHYIMDPEEFLNNPGYMMHIVDSASEEASNLLVFEDAGELLTADAKERAGQGFARLLNLTDGLLGQGLHLKILVTTNEDLGDMHPAIMREGRCAALQQFGNHSNEDAKDWLKAHGYDEEIDDKDDGWQLADLYAKINAKTSLINTDTSDVTQKPEKRRDTKRGNHTDSIIKFPIR